MSYAPYEDLELRRQRAMDEAAAWLVRLQEAAPTSAERSAFTDWLRESPLHVAAMLRVSHTDNSLSVFDGWDAIPTVSALFDDTVVEWPAPMEHRVAAAPHRAPKLKRVGFRFSVAAAALAVCVGVTLWWNGLVDGTKFRTVTGERRDVALQDGSTLRLGPETRVRVLFSKTERYIVLESGAAVFKVAKDPLRPFTVAADRARVRALGTEFGIEKRATTVVVTVVDGQVAVVQAAASLPAVALAANDQLTVPDVGVTSAVRKVNSASSLAWANGRLVFDNDPLGFVVERFNQYNRIHLAVLDPRLAERRLSGSFDATDLESFLAFLHSSLPVTIVRSREGAEVTIAGPGSGGRNTP